VACSGSSVSIADIVAKVQESCGFATNWQDIAKVVASIVSGFNPDAGDKATVAIGIANTVIDAVCGNVKAKVASPQAQMSASGETTVNVNGVPVKGRLVNAAK
jgi:hypothetical protein